MANPPHVHTGIGRRSKAGIHHTSLWRGVAMARGELPAAAPTMRATMMRKCRQLCASQRGNAKKNGRLSRRCAQLIAINYTFLCNLDYALGDQLPNNKLRFSVRVNGAYRLVISFAHCQCRVGTKDLAATNKW